MKILKKTILRKHIIGLSILLSVLIFIIYEFLFCNARFVECLLNEEQLSYNFSLFRMFAYVIFYVVLFLLRRRITANLEKSLENPIKKKCIIIYIPSAIITSIVLLFLDLQIQNLAICLISILMIGLFILYITNNMLQNAVVIVLTFGSIFCIANKYNHPLDEKQHFISALNVSFGNFDFSNPITDNIYQDMEQVLKYNELDEKYFETYKKDITKEVDDLAGPTDYKVFLYIPTGIGILVGRILKGTVLDIYIAGRFFNLMAYTILAILILKLIPFKKKIFFVILFNPLLIALASSYSMDGICTGFIMLFISYGLKLYKKYQDGIEPSVKQKIILGILFIPILLIKGMTYAPVILIILMFPLKQIIQKNKKAIPIIFGVLLILLIAGAILLKSGIPTDERGGETSASDQIANIIQNPIILVRTFLNHFNNNIFNFGWLAEMNQAAFFGHAYILVFFLLVIFTIYIGIYDDDYNFKMKEKVILIITYLATVFLTSLALYITYTPVGLEQINGYQGRYLFPIIALPLMCLSGKHLKSDNNKDVNMIMTIIIGVLIILDIVGMTIMR